MKESLKKQWNMELGRQLEMFLEWCGEDELGAMMLKNVEGLIRLCFLAIATGNRILSIYFLNLAKGEDIDAFISQKEKSTTAEETLAQQKEWLSEFVDSQRSEEKRKALLAAIRKANFRGLGRGDLPVS